MEQIELCECSTQAEIDGRLPIFLRQAADFRELRLTPLLQDLQIQEYLNGPGGKIDRVICSGDPDIDGKACRYEWVRHIRLQCVRAGVEFRFLATGANFYKSGRYYVIPDYATQQAQAARSHLSYRPGFSMGSEIPYRLPSKGYLEQRLQSSKFRSRFQLDEKDRAYYNDKGPDVIRRHTEDFVRMKLAPENPEKDGKQTPMWGHPAFKAQHALGCCCRDCLEKWHNIPSGKRLDEKEQQYIVNLIMEWIERQMKTGEHS